MKRCSLGTKWKSNNNNNNNNNEKVIIMQTLAETNDHGNMATSKRDTDPMALLDANLGHQRATKKSKKKKRKRQEEEEEEEVATRNEGCKKKTSRFYSMLRIFILYYLLKQTFHIYLETFHTNNQLTPNWLLLQSHDTNLRSSPALVSVNLDSSSEDASKSLGARPNKCTVYSHSLELDDAKEGQDKHGKTLIRRLRSFLAPGPLIVSVAAELDLASSPDEVPLFGRQPSGPRDKVESEQERRPAKQEEQEQENGEADELEAKLRRSAQLDGLLLARTVAGDEPHASVRPIEFVKRVQHGPQLDLPLGDSLGRLPFGAGSAPGSLGAGQRQRRGHGSRRARRNRRHHADLPEGQGQLGRSEQDEELRAPHTSSRRRPKRFDANHYSPGGSQTAEEPYLDPLATADRPLVATTKGLVRGITQKIFTGRYVDAFLGIPFAQAPLGKYRFRHPQQVNPWRGELDASRMSSSCYQINDTFFGATFQGTSIWNANTRLHEDCLYLNVWTPFGVANTSLPLASSSSQLPARRRRVGKPQTRSAAPLQTATTSGSLGSMGAQGTGEAVAGHSRKRPVLVWIFGGGFYSGTSTLSLYEGGALASEEDIIVVSMNYRVSALGFLYFGRPEAPGNAGLFDQLMALQWINDNIDRFGGDPQRVTIFGESAGAVSVAFHLLSPLSRNLFSQAILQSGAATCPWGLMESSDIISNGLQLAAQLNCPSSGEDLDAVIQCLLRADPMSIVSQKVNSSRSILNFSFVPVVDGSFLVESPTESLAKANFKRAKILLGSNNDEGSSFLIYLPEFSHCPASATSTSTQSSSQTSSLSSSSSSSLSSSSSSSSSTQNPAPIIDEEDNGSSNNGLPQSNAGGPLMSELRAFQTPNGQPASGLYRHPNGLTNADHSWPLSQPEEAPHFRRSAQTGGSSAAHGQGHQLGSASLLLDSSGQFNFDYQNQNQSDTKPCKPKESLSLTREDFVRILSDGLNPYAEHPIAREAILFEYSNWNWPNDAASVYDAIDKVAGDYYFTCHVNEFANQYAEAGNDVYMYYFRHRSSISPWPKWMGVIHGDEINFVFGEPLNQEFKYSQKEIELSRRMMKYWANFAKYGNPTPQTGDNNNNNNNNNNNSSMVEHWPKYGDRRQYFELHSDHVRVGHGPRAKQCAFWSHYLPQLIRSLGPLNQCQLGASGSSSSSNGNTNANGRPLDGLASSLGSDGTVLQSALIHPYAAGQAQLGHLRNLAGPGYSTANNYQQQPNNGQPAANSIYSAGLGLLIVIVALVGVAGALYALAARRGHSSWKAARSLWAGAGGRNNRAAPAGAAQSGGGGNGAQTAGGGGGGNGAQTAAGQLANQSSSAASSSTSSENRRPN